MEAHIFHPDDYPDLLKSIRLDAAGIKATVKNYSLRFLDIKDDFVEWKLNLPPFAEAFYQYILSENNIPPQSAFFDFYMQSNASYFAQKEILKEKLPALQARIFRTYASLVRDVHFSKYVRENLTSADVIYNTDLDISEGIDLMISVGELHCAVNLFTETKRAHDGKHKKQLRHIRFDNVVYLDLPLRMRRKYGDFYLYGYPEFLKLENLLTTIG